MALLTGATLLAYPSLYEGFGFPVLEAFAAGIPVLTSNVSSLPEVAGDAAVLVDPRDEDAIAAGLAQLLADDDLRALLSAAGLARAASFTWEATAQRDGRGAASGPRPVADRRVDCAASPTTREVPTDVRAHHRTPTCSSPAAPASSARIWSTPCWRGRARASRCWIASPRGAAA